MSDRKVQPCLLISLEGNIASGKSTAADALQKGDRQAVEIVKETVSAVGLELFQKDQKTYALPFQLETLLKRHYDIQIKTKHPNPGVTHVFLDRSAPGDYLFELIQYLCGNISEDGHRMYLNAATASGTEQIFRSLNMILYLHTDPKRCEQSVKKRGNIDANTRLEYLYELDHMHVYWHWYHLVIGDMPIRIVDWTHFGTSETLWKALNGPAPRIVRVTDRKDVPTEAKGIFQGEFKATVYFIDGDKDRQPLPPAYFPNLPAKYRSVHTQEFKDMMNCLLKRGWTVYWIGKEPCLLDYFIDMKAH